MQQVKQKREVPLYIYLVTIVLSLVFIFLGNKYTSEGFHTLQEQGYQDVAKVRVTQLTEIVEDEIETSGTEGFHTKVIRFQTEVLSGELKGQMLEGEQSFNSYMKLSPKEVEVGDKILMYKILDPNVDEASVWVYGEYVRADAMIVLGIIFLVSLLIFGGIKGFQTIVSLTFTILAIFGVFVPAVLTGRNIYFWAIVICLFTTVMSLVLISGINKKTLAAITGCMGGLLVSGGIILVMDIFLKLTGVVNDESVYLIMLNPENPIDLKAMFFGAMLIGAMGAIMDVSMSIASSMSELHEKAPDESFMKRVQSGMRIGKDIMGTMANTLVLAYIGGSLSIVLLLITYNANLMDIFNREMVIIEVLQALSGSFGILFSIPITTFVSSTLYTKGVRKNETAA